MGSSQEMPSPPIGPPQVHLGPDLVSWNKPQSLVHLHGKLLVGLGVHLVPEVLQSVEAVAVELGARSGGQQRPAMKG